MDGGALPLLPEILSPNDPVVAKTPNGRFLIDIRSTLLVYESSVRLSITII